MLCGFYHNQKNFYIATVLWGWVLRNLTTLMQSLIAFGGALEQIFSQGKPMYVHLYSTSMQAAVCDLNFIESIFMCLIAIVFFFAMIACALGIIKAGINLYIDLLAMLPYAPLMVATATGAPSVAQVSVTYIKSLVGKCVAASMVAVLISICYYVAPAVSKELATLIEDAIDASSIVTALTHMLRLFLSASLTTAAISSVEQKIKSNFGL